MTNQEMRDALISYYDRGKRVGLPRALNDRFIAALAAVDELERTEDNARK